MLDIRNKLIEFDGNVPHAVMKFEGTRFRVVFFTRAEQLSKTVHEKLQEHCFRMLFFLFMFGRGRV